MNEFKKLAMFQIRITKPHQLAVMITTNQDWHDKTYYDVGISTSTPAASTPVFYTANSLKYLPDCLYFQTRTHLKHSLQGLLFLVQAHAEPFRPVWQIIHRKCLHHLLFSSLPVVHHLHIRYLLSWINGWWHWFGFSDRLSSKVRFWPSQLH